MIPYPSTLLRFFADSVIAIYSDNRVPLEIRVAYQELHIGLLKAMSATLDKEIEMLEKEESDD